MRISKLCFEVNGGDCKNKVSAQNGYICAAGHSKRAARSAISISKMNHYQKAELGKITQNKTTQWELFHFKDINVQPYLAQNPSIDNDLQWELFHTADIDVQYRLAQNPSIKKDLQWELFHTADWTVLHGLAQNPSIKEELQWELFHTADWAVLARLAQIPSISRELAIELAKLDEFPYGYAKDKPLAELIQPENLALLNQYPRAFGRPYLDRLLDYPQEEKEESKALALHSYFIYEKGDRGEHTRYYKDKILERYPNDQEIILILSSESAQ